MTTKARCRRGLAWFSWLVVSCACSSNDGAPKEVATTGSPSGSTASGATTTSGGTGAVSATVTTGTVGSGGALPASGDGGAAGSGASAGTVTPSGAGGTLGGAGMDVTSSTSSDADPGDMETDPPELAPVTIYYLDVTRALVMSVGAEGGEPRVVVEEAGQGPDGIAVDISRGHIYWTNMGVPSEDDGFILRSDLDGSNLTTIVEEGATFTPKQLKIELDSAKLYWGDREGMRIQRCNLDGSELETLVTIAQGEEARADRANHAVGISVDTSAGYVYWIQKGPPNGGEGSIRRAGLELPDAEDPETRSDIEVLYAGLPEPIDLDIDIDAGVMYWTDRGDGTINRAPVEVPDGATASTRDDREILVSGVETAIGIWLDSSLGHVYYTGNDVVGRVDLDGANDTLLVPDAGVLTGVTVVRLP